MLPYTGSLHTARVGARVSVLPSCPQTFSRRVFMWVTYPQDSRNSIFAKGNHL